MLAVGLTNGGSSYGPTSVDGTGRVKPDLVTPSSQTSYATPMVASAAALAAVLSVLTSVASSGLTTTPGPSLTRAEVLVPDVPPR